jgi:hypothetical protein
MSESDIAKLIERARFLASNQNDPHSVTITELCDHLEYFVTPQHDGSVDPLKLLAHFTAKWERLGAVAARHGLPNAQWAVRPSKVLFAHRLVERTIGADCHRWRISQCGQAKLRELASKAGDVQ